MTGLITFLTSVYVLLLLVFHYFNVYILGYGVTIYLTVIYLVVLYFLILILNLRNKNIIVYNKSLFIYLSLFMIYFIFLSRSLDYISHSIITAMQLILFFAIIPRYISVDKYIKSICIILVLFTSFFSLFTIINNFYTIEYFLKIGFDAKKYVIPHFSNINYDATILTYGVFSSYVLYTMLHKRVYFVFTCINLLAIFLTYSRTAYLMMIIMFVLYKLIINIKITKHIKKYIFLTIFFLASIIILLNLNQIYDLILGQGGDLLTGREIIWNDAILIIKDSLIFGNGLYYWDDNVKYVSSSHNGYLNILIEYGLIGFIFFISLLIYIIKVSIKIISKETSLLLNVKVLIVSFIIGFYVGLVFETRRLGGIRVIDILPVIVISMLFSIDSLSSSKSY